MDRKEYMRIYLKKWREDNKEKIKKSVKELVKSGYYNDWKKRNRKSTLEAERKYLSINRERVNLQHKLRAKRLKEVIGSHTEKEWLEKKREFKYKCALCNKKKKLTKDHIVPIWEDNSTNDILNIRPLCSSCNSSEGAKYQHKRKLDYQLNNTQPMPSKKQRISGKQKKVSSPNKKNK